MKNSFVKIFFLIVLFTATLFVYEMTLAEIEVMNKDKIKLSEIFNEKKNIIETKQVEVQKLSSEERIIRIASDSLGLIRSRSPFEILNVDKSQIEQLEKIINSKYE
jgi:cell division protein FtsL